MHGNVDKAPQTGKICGPSGLLQKVCWQIGRHTLIQSVQETKRKLSHRRTTNRVASVFADTSVNWIKKEKRMQAQCIFVGHNLTPCSFLQ